MPRPRLGNERMVKITIMIPPEMLAQLDDLTAQRQQDSPFVSVERSAVCREVLARGLETLQPGTPIRRTTRKAG